MFERREAMFGLVHERKEERALARRKTGDEKYQTLVQTFTNHHLHGYCLD